MSVQPVAIIRSMGGLVFDAVFEETHESELEITDDPVETGASVSDHAYMLPLKLTISAGVSDVSLRGWGSGYYVENGHAVNDHNGDGVGDKFWKRNLPKDPFASDVESRSVRAFKMLKELQALAEPFDVQTGLTLYKNMVCKRLRSSQDKDSSNALMFTAELREINIVDTEIVQYEIVNPKPGPTTRQAKKRRSRGEKQIQPENNVTKKQSLLKHGQRLYTGA